MNQLIEYREGKHLQVFSGIGGLGRGFNQGSARVGNMVYKPRCIGGIDSDPAACRDFEHLVGVKATCLDLFSYEQYCAFHGHEPPPGWREATPEDIRQAGNYEFPNIVAMSAPCKGFSGLLSESRSKGPKYQALNGLTVRGLWLVLEAYKDDPPELLIFENVPRIQNRGRHLLDQITALLHSYGYAVAETTHDCGELGGLAQSRKRFLLVARHMRKVPPYLYEPPKRPLRAVGEILDKLPLPGDTTGGPMHKIPALQWKTWVRLAFVEAGSDWRSLNKLRVVDGKLADYLIVPESKWEGGGRLGVTAWSEPSGTVQGCSRPENGKFSVADPRQQAFERGYGVTKWSETGRTVQGQSLPSNGEFSVADPRFQGEQYRQFGVTDWKEHAATITSQRSPGQGQFSVADPRMAITENSRQNIFRIVAFDGTCGAITGADHVTGGAACVSDPRPQMANPFGKYEVTPWNGNTGTVIGGHRSEEGAYAVADPRAPREFTDKKYKVTDYKEPSNSVIGASTTGQGAFAVADPRCGLDRGKGDHYLTGGQYGVIPWDSPSGVISGHAGHDSGRFSVADPRMPIATDKLICVIRALDNTWHRPFTTLELAALQSLVDPDELFDLDGASDSAKRERIGNAVPPAAAQAIANVMAETLLLAWSGQTFQLSAQPIWVRPLNIALSVKMPEAL